MPTEGGLPKLLKPLIRTTFTDQALSRSGFQTPEAGVGVGMVVSIPALNLQFIAIAPS